MIAEIATAFRDGDGTPFEDLVSRGRSAGGPRGAAALVVALTKPAPRAADHKRAALLLRDLLGPGDAAVGCAWFARDGQLPRTATPMDRARAGVLGPDEAARTYDAGGRTVRAAIAFERAGAKTEARQRWLRVAERADGDYERALAFLNVVRNAAGAGEARDAAARCIHAAESAADELLRSGERERAFDAYTVLLTLGRLTGVFEDAVEGYVGATRILQGDNLRRHAVGLFREAIRHAVDAGELAAAAVFAHDLAAYATTTGHTELAAWASEREAELLLADAERPELPRAIAEQRLLAAAAALAETDAFLSVRRVFLALGDKASTLERRAHFAAAARRYQGATDPPRRFAEDVAPPSLPAVWHVDLLEWENRGSILDATGDVILDPDEPEPARRHALVARVIGAHRAEAPELADALAAQQLGEAGVYGVLSPLEHLARSPSPETRVAVATALGRCFFKRSFAALRTLSIDPDVAVRRAVDGAIERLSFPHGIDALIRFVHAAREASTRAAALRALAKVDHEAATHALVELVTAGAPAERAAALRAIQRELGATERVTHAARERGLTISWTEAT